MERINFGGIQAKVLALSPHKGYFLFRLSDRIAIKGIYTPDFVWDSVTDNLKGFLSQQFTLYVGSVSYEEAEIIKANITQAGGTPDEDIRISKFVLGFPYEVRAIGLSPEYLVLALSQYPMPAPVSAPVSASVARN